MPGSKPSSIIVLLKEWMAFPVFFKVEVKLILRVSPSISTSPSALWSKSTPMTHKSRSGSILTKSLASENTPLPVGPEAWKMTSISFEYIVAAIVRPIDGSVKLPAYWISISIESSTAWTPATKPASNLSITTPSTPPTNPTLFVWVVVAAATPARKAASSSAKFKEATFGKSTTESTIPKYWSGYCSAVSWTAGCNL